MTNNETIKSDEIQVPPTEKKIPDIKKALKKQGFVEIDQETVARFGSTPIDENNHLLTKEEREEFLIDALKIIKETKSKFKHEKAKQKF